MTTQNATLAIRYYDGRTNVAHPAQLSPIAAGVLVQYADQEIRYANTEMTYVGGVGKVLPAIELPQDARIEFLSSDVPDWLQVKHKTLSERVHRIEKSWKWIVVSFVAMLAVMLVTLKWGIPYASYLVAQQLPEQTLQKLGDEVEQFIVAQTEPTELSSQRQQQIKDIYREKIQANIPAKVVFRKGGDFIEANALAIPNGTIILTDELVKLTNNDNELLGVLAHEQGHLDERHSLQQALTSVGMTVLYVAVTGDTSDILSGLPLAMVASKYSQNFELQADQHAIDELKRQYISPQYMADFLQRLSKNSEEGAADSDFLQSHPATAKRISQIQAQIH